MINYVIIVIFKLIIVTPVVTYIPTKNMFLNAIIIGIQTNLNYFIGKNHKCNRKSITRYKSKSIV